MRAYFRPSYGLFVSVIVLSGSLHLLPTPDGVNRWLPVWSLWVLLYWAFRFPYYVGLGTAWMVGLFVDLLTGGILGKHAFSYVIVLCVVLSFRRRILSASFFSQLMLINSLFVLNNWVLQIIGHCCRHELNILYLGESWLSGIIGTVSLLVALYTFRPSV